jgi:hypothetical protein
MSAPQCLTIYLDAPTLSVVTAGRHNFFRRLMDVITAQGWQVNLAESTLSARLEAPAKEGFALFHMEPPTHPTALTCRRTYVGAFWHIEAQAERWLWPVAQEVFDPETIDPVQAQRFVQNWKKRLYPADFSPSDEGFAFIPLQGQLRAHRSFQAMSPVAMIELALAQTGLPLVASLHPKEIYTAEEIAALQDLAQRHPRFRIYHGESAEALRACSFVITQNSGLAFEGYFLRKPAVLFARSDFHHIAGSVPRDGVEGAFAALQNAPDFDRYLYWFLQQRAINAGRAECEAQILTALRGHGWPI